MPTYVYETIPSAGEAPQRFEFQQRMSDAPFTHHPDTGVALRRVFTAPFIGGAKGGASRKETASVSAETKTSTESTESTSASSEPVYRHVCGGGGCSH